MSCIVIYTLKSPQDQCYVVHMLINILFLMSQVFAEVEAPNQHLIPKESQDQVEKLDRTYERRLDKADQGLCGEIKGRKLFRSAIIGIPVGTVITIGGGVLVLASIDSNVSNAGAIGAIGTVYTGLGTLAFSAIALPMSVHMLYKDAVRKKVEHGVPLGMLYLADGMLVSGVALTGFVPSAPLLVPIGYIFNVLQGVTILDSINMKRKRVCRNLD